MNKNIYRFKSFNRSSKLPLHSDDYTTLDMGTFQVEHSHRKKGIKNIAQYMKDVEGFEPLKARLEKVMKEYDAEWKKTK